MTIAQVYANYQIMPALQLHQLRVAAVAQLVSSALSIPIDTTAVTTACLLHDMGNILKFDLNKFPEFLEPEGPAYWRKVQTEYRKKYGKSEHVATRQIVAELQVSDHVIDLIAGIGFRNIPDHLTEKDMEKLLCEYADCRVAPHGIVSLDERLEDLRERYQSKYPSAAETAERNRLFDLERQAEKYIFEHCSIQPQDITEAKAAKLFPQLRNLELIIS